MTGSTSGISSTALSIGVEALVNELTSLGHGPIRVLGYGGYLDPADAPSFTLSVNPAPERQIKIEWQSSLESSGHEAVGRVGIMNLAAVAMEIHHAIERHKVALGLVEKEREDAEAEAEDGADRLRDEFRLTAWGKVEVVGSVDRYRRARFRVAVADLTEDEAREILEAMKAKWYIGTPVGA